MNKPQDAMYDVLIAGAGLSGLLCAVFAARKGLRTRLVYRGQGALGIGGGTMDVLGYAPTISEVSETSGKVMQRALASPLDGLAALGPEHPYTLAGEACVLDALAAFSSLSAELGMPHSLRRDPQGRPLNTALLTAAGTAKPSCLLPPSMTMQGITDTAAEGSEVLIVGFEGLKDIYPKLMGQGFSRLRRFAGRTLTPVTLPSPIQLVPGGSGPRLRDLSSLDFARFIDTPDGLDWLKNCLKNCLNDAVNRQCSFSKDTVILLPPILGLTNSTSVHKALEHALGCHVHEVLTPPPGITGLRLRAVLFKELSRLGVAIAANATITGYEATGDQCTALLSEQGGRPMRWLAKHMIMATGGVYGEGLVVGPCEVIDPVFPNAALTPDINPSSPDWAQPTVYPALCAGEAQHGFSRLGVQVNANFQPLAKDGKPLFSNVFAVGRAVGGYDYAAEKSGNGVALVSAFAVVSQLPDTTGTTGTTGATGTTGTTGAATQTSTTMEVNS